MISYQKNLKSPVEPCGRKEFVSILASKQVEEITDKVSALRAQELSATDEAARRALHDEQGRLKRQLPAFLFMANFPSGRRRQADARLTGLVMVDFDGVDDPKETFAQMMAAGHMESLSPLLVHITPSGHGLRLVCKADPAVGNLADNQKRIADALGMLADESCKDASRISYAFPASRILFLNEELFTYSNEEYDKKYGEMYRAGNSMCVNSVFSPAHADAGSAAGAAGGSDSRSGGACSAPAEKDGDCVELAVNADGRYAFKGIAFDDIIREWWRQQGGEPVVGERNQKLHRLAAHLRYLCDNSPAALGKVMPSLGLSAAELSQLCASACKLKIYGSTPRAMRKVLEAVGIKDAEEQEGDSDTRNLEAEYLSRLSRLVLPPALRIVADSVPQSAAIGAVLAALPMFYTLATRVKFTYFDGAETRLSGMTFIIGPAASGKSFILNLDRMIMEPIREADRAGRRVEQEYRDSKELNKNKQKQMEKPHPVIRITPIQISNTMLALRMRDAVDTQDPTLHLHVYSCEAELATAIRAQKGGSWIEKNDIYCKAFHNEYWGMDYANDQAINGEIQVNLNLVVSGTEDAFDRLIPSNTVLSGLPTRLMYFQMPSSHFTMIAKGKRKTSEADRKTLLSTAYALDSMRGSVDAKKLTDHMYKWCERIARRAELEDDEELDDLRKRTALIGTRAGVVYALISQQEQIAKGQPAKFGKDELSFAEFVADYCLYSQYRKFAERMKEQKQRVIEYAGRKRQPMLLADIYNRLSKTFSIDDLSNLRPGVSRNVLRSNLFKWKQKGYIKLLQDTKTYEKNIQQV